MERTDTRVSAAAATATRWLLNVAVVGVLLAGAGLLLPSLLGYERYVITGGSMSGTFERGSLVFEKPVPVTSLRVGDIITYQPPADSGVADLVTHRIHAVKHTDGRAVLRTKGDANPKPDPWTFVLDADTQPRLTMAVPHAGTVLLLLGDSGNRLLLLGVPAAFVALVSLRELVTALRPARRPATS